MQLYIIKESLKVVSPEEYWGFSSSGIEIHFYYVEGEIRSFFPVKQ